MDAEQDQRLRNIETAIVTYPGGGVVSSRLTVPGAGYDYLPAIINQNNALMQAIKSIPGVDTEALAEAIAEATVAELGPTIVTDADLAASTTQVLAAIAGVDEATLATFGLQRISE